VACRSSADLGGGRPGKALDSYYSILDQLTRNLLVLRDAAQADADASGGFGTADFSVGVGIAQADVWLHDTDAAELTLQTVKPDEKDPSIAAGLHFVRGLLAMETTDAAAAVTELEALTASLSNPKVNTGYPNAACWVARAEEAAGHPNKADELLKEAGTFLDCHRFRGDILDGRGDWAGAEKAYADAVALAPDLPAGYFSWGVALFKHGDLEGAVTKLSEAHSKGPHWADPLKGWGDVLAKQGKTSEAIAKYDEALQFAPNWKELIAAREALRKTKS
jgi:tetratricopeptide (TPR) repeat protein